jgi:prophage antirepressor-like protein
MKNQLTVQQFHNDEFGSLDIVTIDGKPYFPAADCAKILGYTNPHKAIRDHCKGVNESFSPSAGGNQKKKYIPEGDLYRLIIRSKLLAAERFETWVFDEVLPTIRKYGAYITQDTLAQMIGSPEFTETLLDALTEEYAKNIALTDKLDELAPRARYCDKVLLSGQVIQTSIIAKDYGMTAIAFNRLLHDFGIQYCIGSTWLLYKEYADKGFTNSNTYPLPNGSTNVHTYWTQKGRRFLYDVLSAVGIHPQVPTGRAFII